MLWEELKATEFPEAVKKSKGVCVIPIGAMEKHGPHCPVGTDNLKVEYAARLAAEEEPVVVFPTFGFGQLHALKNYDGSICLSTELMLDYLSEICREIARSGFKKILLLNSHGGNPALLSTFCQMVHEEKKDYVVSFIKFRQSSMEDLYDAAENRRDKFPYLTDEDVAIMRKYMESPKEIGHADCDEMYLTEAARPGLVDVSRMGDEDGESNGRMDHLANKGIFASGLWLANYPNSFQSSHFPYMTSTLVRAYLEIRIERIKDIYKTFKEDTELLKYNDEWNKSW